MTNGLGPIQFPFRPPKMVLTDRDDGTLWLLSWNSDAHTEGVLSFVATMRFSITDVIPANSRPLYTFGPYEGPYIADPSGRPILRFFVRGGRVGYEDVNDQGEAAAGNNQARIFGQVGLSPTVLEVILPASWAVWPNNIAWEENTL